MTTENGKREGRNWPEMTSSGGSVGKLGRTFVRFWGPAKRSCRPRLFSIPGQNLDWSFIFKKISHDGKPVSLSTYTYFNKHSRPPSWRIKLKPIFHRTHLNFSLTTT
ncbi:hypothetical protein T12_3244 [Trichinella patagoniensis]|uniref:Uncharacterized protein n=1 Tax=Trichinella patagoniensis TaxID=990121 RepID=A0A0V0ZTY3_9BILA|nr:hypothetical protein T12_3244 [Trichinella patagoniensis]